MNTAGRPTLRCLEEDLSNDWDSAAAQVEGRLGGNGQKPLAELGHPIIRKAADDFPADARDSQPARESISGLSAPVWWKVKIGARWRGAVWEDPRSGQAWLCAAGYRRENEASDFYKRFMATVGARGAEFFLPTEKDHERLDREQRVWELARWSSGIQAAVREVLGSVWDGGSKSLTICHPRDDDQQLARCTIEVTREEIDDETALDLVVTVECLEYSLYPLVQWAEIVCLTAIDPREQQWASLPVAGTPTHSQLLAGPEINAVWVQAHRDITPGEVSPGDTAHYAHRSGLTESTIEGVAVKAICGAWFVPRQDHGSIEKCQHCAAIYKALPAD